MSYRDILVYLDPSTAGASFIDAVVAFASSQNAHLTGLNVIDIPPVPDYVTANLPREVVENHRKAFLDRAKKTETDFSRACDKAGLFFEWRCVEDDAARAVIRAARYADLVVLAGGAGVDSADRTGVADRVVLESGRPVLVMPAIETGSSIGSQVIVAWNASKEAVRAVHDALPLLLEAKWVKVLSVNPQISDEAHAEIPGLDIGRHLARHNVRADAQSITVDLAATGKSLLAWASEEQADLIVMGAYGHNRWRELILGGVTAHVLHHAGIPVLMSH